MYEWRQFLCVFEMLQKIWPGLIILSYLSKCVRKGYLNVLCVPTSQCRLNGVIVFLLLGSAMGSDKVEFCRQFIFNLYFDDLSKSLKAWNTGCMLDNTLVNQIMYADDLVVFSPCTAGLRQLLTVCSEYGVVPDTKFNADKSAVMICRTKEDRFLMFPSFKLPDNNLRASNKIKYLITFYLRYAEGWWRHLQATPYFVCSSK